jgi:hypothetical protein
MSTDPSIRALAALAAGLCAVAVTLAACDESTTIHETPPTTADAAVVDPPIDSGITILPDGAIADTGAPVDDCVKNPKTHLEIINACTTAQKIDKHPTLPLLLPDGGLPPPP